MDIKKNLEDRLRSVIHKTCNAIGCKNCGLKHDDGCTATELQDKILEIEFEEIKANDN